MTKLYSVIRRVMGAACLAVSYTAANSAPAVVQNDVFWKDTSGNNIYSQGGGVTKVGSTYYWYGVKYEGAVTYAANPAKANSDTRFNSVTAYSSTDLVHWKSEGAVISAGAAGSTFDLAIWLGRLGVVYNKNTKKYSPIFGPCGMATERLCPPSRPPTIAAKSLLRAHKPDGLRKYNPSLPHKPLAAKPSR